MQQIIKFFCFLLLGTLLLWLLIAFLDFKRVYREDPPFFCMKTEENEEAGYIKYVGLGYSFEVMTHPYTGDKEFNAYLFGIEVKSTVTN